MMFESLGAKATAPTANVGASSVSGAHVVPPSRVSQTPPLPTPISQCNRSRGSTAIEDTRPELARRRGPSGKGAGPRLVHCPPSAAAVVAHRHATGPPPIMRMPTTADHRHDDFAIRPYLARCGTILRDSVTASTIRRGNSSHVETTHVDGSARVR